MARSKAAAFVACLAGVTALAAAAEPASAWGHRRSAPFPQFAAPRYYSSPKPVRYYRVCAYGDCACLHAIAVRTGSLVWSDRYDACRG